MDEVGVRQLLDEERMATLERIETLTSTLEGVIESSAGANADDEHDPEGSTVAYERARVAALLAEAESNLSALDLALEKLAAGTYAVCEECGSSISGERLEALPAARRCFACASGRAPR